MAETKVYVAMVNDRHFDPEVEVFSTPESAISCAKGWARAATTRAEGIKEEPVVGWLYHAYYSREGDSVWVVEKVLDGG